MATNIVGSKTVAATFIKGQVAGLKQQVEIWHQPGVDGYGSHTLGKTNATFVFQCVLFDTLANVLKFAADIELLVGELVAITDDWGTNHTNMLIQTAGPLERIVDFNNGGVRGMVQIEGVKVA